MMKGKFISLWIPFLLYFFCYMTMEVELGVLLSIWTTGLAIYLLIKNKLPSKKEILLSIVFAVLVSVAYLGLGRGVGVVLTNGIMSGIPTLFCSLAVFSVMQKRTDIKVVLRDKKYAPLISIGIAIVVGALLSVLNCFLMKGSNPLDFGISVSRLVVCLNPAIYEEMACRAIFMAFCLYVIGDKKPTKFQQFTMWFMMCVPHTVAHDYDIISTVLLCVLFGLPFTFLQRKRDITSAMISHGLVDAVRFTIFGLGL
ncbi:MAG: hypothetical protein IJX66_08895 [Lachnospiraceae bacterium]|nr:hypothetical protein [Lachnospiraceae bacterium]